MLGLTLMPNQTFACGSNAKKSCCKKEYSEKSADKDCCKKEKQNSNDKGDCSGKCGDKSCNCSISNFSLVLPFFQDDKNNNFNFSSEKQMPSYLEADISSGFYSIWTPPNIS